MFAVVVVGTESCGVLTCWSVLMIRMQSVKTSRSMRGEGVMVRMAMLVGMMVILSTMLLIGSSLIVGMGTRTILFETVKVHEDKANGDEDGYAQGNGAANGTRYAIFR